MDALLKNANFNTSDDRKWTKNSLFCSICCVPNMQKVLNTEISYMRFDLWKLRKPQHLGHNRIRCSGQYYINISKRAYHNCLLQVSKLHYDTIKAFNEFYLCANCGSCFPDRRTAANRNPSKIISINNRISEKIAAKNYFPEESPELAAKQADKLKEVELKIANIQKNMPKSTTRPVCTSPNIRRRVISLDSGFGDDEECATRDIDSGDERIEKFTKKLEYKNPTFECPVDKDSSMSLHKSFPDIFCDPLVPKEKKDNQKLLNLILTGSIPTHNNYYFEEKKFEIPFYDIQLSINDVNPKRTELPKDNQQSELKNQPLAVGNKFTTNKHSTPNASIVDPEEDINLSCFSFSTDDASSVTPPVDSGISEADSIVEEFPKLSLQTTFNKSQVLNVDSSSSSAN